MLAMGSLAEVCDTPLPKPQWWPCHHINYEEYWDCKYSQGEASAATWHSGEEEIGRRPWFGKVYTIYKVTGVYCHSLLLLCHLQVPSLTRSPRYKYTSSAWSQRLACTSNHQVACTSNPQLACTQRILQYPQVRSTVLVTFSPGSTNPLSLSLQRRH